MLATPIMHSNEAFHVCVLGAGTMGSGIAAHLANCGFKVTLLDLTRESAQAAFTRAQSIKPPHFYGPDSEARITLGGIDQDLDAVRTADWVCEAIIEKVDAKRALYAAIEPLLQPEAMISTNTSGLQISVLKEGRSADFRRRFLGTHFFNPPRYLKLLELIPTDETDPVEVKRVTNFLEERVGRRVVVAIDTPGFIANRFGMWSMIHAVHVAEKMRLDIEAVDMITGPFLGRPKSGSFRLNDLVGMDIMADIAGNLADRCQVDAFHANLTLPRSVQHLIANNALGQKSGRGYYMREGNSFSALDLQSLLYRDTIVPDLPAIKAVAKEPIGSRIRHAMQGTDDAAEFLRRHLIPVFQYADSIRREVCHNVHDFDSVMRWGFAWEMGPFEMMDAIGHDLIGVNPEPYYRESSTGGSVKRELRSHVGSYEPITEPKQYRDLNAFKVTETHQNFEIQDVDGTIAVCLKTKLGTITPDLVRELTPWVAKTSQPFIIANAQRFFSVGYDLQFFVDRVAEEDFDGVDQGLAELHALCDLLRTKKCVAAVHGYCLGAGLEIALACSQIVAHPECQIGLPECKVGLLPGGSGAARMRVMSQSSAKDMVSMVKQLVLGYTSTCAADAKAHHLMRASDVVILHPDELVWQAREAAQSVAAEPKLEWANVEGPITGMIDQELAGMVQSNKITEYDATIGASIKEIFSKAKSWEEGLAREREEFLHLLHKGQTIARIKHMLENGKPLRN